MRPRVLACGLVAAGLTALPSCGDDNPVGPSVEPVVSRVQIEGPETIAPGQSAQFTAIATYTDGTRAAATDTQWSASGGKLTITGAGLAQASSEPGEGTVSVSVPIGGNGRGRRNGFMEVVIVPPGTFRVTGSVTEQGLPVPGAQVDVSGTAIRAPTDLDGRYRAYGVPANATLTVTREGYHSQTRTLNLTRHGIENFALTLSGPRLGLTGDYSVTIEAGDACPQQTGLRDDLRLREYAATLTQKGPEVTVQLTDAIFNVRNGRGDRFLGRVDAAGAAFRLEDASFDYYYYNVSTFPSIVERLADGTYLVTVGDAQTRGSDSEMSGSLLGQMRHLRADFPGNYVIQACSVTQRISLNKR